LAAVAGLLAALTAAAVLEVAGPVAEQQDPGPDAVL